LNPTPELEKNNSEQKEQKSVTTYRYTSNIFISIHKPPAWNRLAPMKHALAVTVEPFKFSPA
jgi:hypothetical protein